MCEREGETVCVREREGDSEREREIPNLTQPNFLRGRSKWYDEVVQQADLTWYEK